jgi:D-alanyl-lipoteichoic acid acyltransferase DltB (MBOAT superfamily)
MLPVTVHTAISHNNDDGNAKEVRKGSGGTVPRDWAVFERAWTSPEMLLSLVACVFYFGGSFWRLAQLSRLWRPHLHHLHVVPLYGAEHPLDASDPQWWSFRSHLPLLFVLALVSVALTHALARLGLSYARWRTTHLVARLAVGVLFVAVLHRWHAIQLVGVLLAHYGVVRWLGAAQWRGVPLAPAFSWCFCVALLFTTEHAGAEPRLSDWFGESLAFMDAPPAQLVRWASKWNLIMLKLISFASDYARMRRHVPSGVNWERHANKCALCSGGERCEERRADTPLPEAEYGVLQYLWFVCYPPLYLAGPMATFNGAVSALAEPQRAVVGSAWALYALRWLAAFALMELLTSHLYVWAFAKHGMWKRAELTIYELGFLCHWSLFVLWLKFTVIWRFFRAWALADGVDVRENMLRCVNNNYTLTGFWRGWHHSYNAWLIRYLYVPLGGSHTRHWNVWVVFTFVAIWHDLHLKLLAWAWIICLLIVPEVLLRNWAQDARRQWLRDAWYYRPLCGVCAAAMVVALMFINLIGFFTGIDGIRYILAHVDATFLVSAIGTFYIGAMIMFKVRAAEATAGDVKGGL